MLKMGILVKKIWVYIFMLQYIYLNIRNHIADLGIF